MLTAAKELELSTKLKEMSEGRAREAVRDQLVCPHLRQVVKLAMKYRDSGVPMADLIQEGSIGLMTAVEKFEPEKGNRLSTYAQWWIKAALQEYVFANRTLAKISNTARNKKIIKLLAIERKNALMNSEDPFTETVLLKVAEKADSSIEEVRAISNLSNCVSLSDPAKKDEDEGSSVGDFVEDNGPSPEELVADFDEKTHRNGVLLRVLKELEPRERLIFIARRLRSEPLTLEKLADHFKISRERVRQIEVKAYDRVAEMTRHITAKERWSSQDKRFNHSQTALQRLARPAARIASKPEAWTLGGPKEQPVLVHRQ
jgi:RNA polymerase sigma-32 factor